MVQLRFLFCLFFFEWNNFKKKKDGTEVPPFLALLLGNRQLTCIARLCIRIIDSLLFLRVHVRVHSRRCVWLIPCV